MPWYDGTTFSAGDVITRNVLNREVRDRLRALNGFFGHPDGTLRSLDTDGIAYGNGTGTFGVLAALGTGVLLVGTGGTAPGTLAISGIPDGHLLVADSNQAQGIKWHPDGFDVAEAQMFGAGL